MQLWNSIHLSNFKFCHCVLKAFNTMTPLSFSLSLCVKCKKKNHAGVRVEQSIVMLRSPLVPLKEEHKNAARWR